MTDDATLRLGNGLRLGYARFGCRGGRPAFYCHGLPGSRHEGVLFHQACCDAGLELIAPDRPGYGLSDPLPGERLQAWPGLIAALADHLQFDTFFVIGVSGGAPYALACANALAERVIGTALCCGLADVTRSELRVAMGLIPRMGFWMAARSPLLLRSTYGVVATLAARTCPERVVGMMGRLNTPVDREALRQPAVRAAYAATLRAAFQQGPVGGCADMRAVVAGWPFQLARIPRLQVWHGDCDGVVPLAHAIWLAGQVPAARLTTVRGEGHFSLPLRYAGAITRALTESPAAGERMRSPG